MPLYPAHMQPAEAHLLHVICAAALEELLPEPKPRSEAWLTSTFPEGSEHPDAPLLRRLPGDPPYWHAPLCPASACFPSHYRCTKLGYDAQRLQHATLVSSTEACHTYLR